MSIDIDSVKNAYLRFRLVDAAGECVSKYLCSGDDGSKPGDDCLYYHFELAAARLALARIGIEATSQRVAFT